MVSFPQIFLFMVSVKMKAFIINIVYTYIAQMTPTFVSHIDLDIRRPPFTNTKSQM